VIHKIRLSEREKGTERERREQRDRQREAYARERGR